MAEVSSSSLAKNVQTSSAECIHLWDPSFETRNGGTFSQPIYYTHKYDYTCRHCKEKTMSNHILPCRHEMKEVEHKYGPGYIKQICKHCRFSSFSFK